MGKRNGNSKMEYFRIKELCTTKKITNKVKIQPMYRMKIFSKHVSHKAFLR
jgi:hypothetical protein